MINASLCWCCKGQLEPVQQFRFLVETDTLDDPAYLEQIRTLPSIKGRPVPVCQECQARLEAAPPVPAPAVKPTLPRLLGAVGALSVGLLLTNMLTTRG